MATNSKQTPVKDNVPNLVMITDEIVRQVRAKRLSDQMVEFYADKQIKKFSERGLILK